jgi:21S rRNA (uridine2791-2'-O)-methyltransferase
VSPGGRVVGVDIIPALPPKGVSTIQGNFLSPQIQKMIRDFLSDPKRGRPHESRILYGGEVEGYIDRERRESAQEAQEAEADEGASDPKKVVNVVLSDMWEPWVLQPPNYVRSLIIPWHRMMNTSGIPFRDHAGSMDLCNEALLFCLDVLKPHGHFVCKFYAGKEDRALEDRLKKVFEKVMRDKPNSSRKVDLTPE